MTYSSTLTLNESTNIMSIKYSVNSNSTICMHALTTASSIFQQLSIWATSSLWVASPWPLTRSKSFKIGPNSERLKTYSLFGLGYAKIYQYILPYSNITVLLINPTHKGTLWNFSDACQSTFESLKKAFITAPVLMHWILALCSSLKQTCWTLWPCYPIHCISDE